MSDCQQVRNATEAVEMNHQPVDGFNLDAPLCPEGEELTSTLFFDDMEGSGSWVTNNPSRWYYVSGYSHSGMRSYYGNDYPPQVSDSYLSMNTSILLSSDSYLHFSHAYGFEAPDYDGGVLEFSTDGGVTWYDAGSLFEINGYKGSIASGYSNPLADRSAFLADSHGYISSRLNLASFTGQSIRFRWRMGLDFSVSNLGWLIDDVRIYACEIQTGAFSKASPSDGATGVSTNPTLTWDSSSEANSYEYCYSTSDSCSNWTNNGTSTSVTLSGLAHTTMYYWHVRAISSSGIPIYSDGSADAFWSFTTQASLVPGSFGKSTPANALTDVPTSPTLEWSSSAGAASYEYCYDSTNDGACTPWTSTGTNTSASLSGLSMNTTYYWQVRAINSFGSTYADESATAFWSFSTGSNPGAFNKSIPLNGAINQSTSPTLEWSSSMGAASYEYCYDSTNDDACDPWTSTGTNTSASLSGLSMNTTYYWQVRAINSFGSTYADESATAFWSFSTGSDPGAFNKSSPLNGAINQSTSPTLEWSSSMGAASYEYCYDSTNDDVCAPWTSTGTNTSTSLSGLSTNTTYYWQVRAVNDFGITYADGLVNNFSSFWTAHGRPVYIPLVRR
jgi:hypothetical protein